MISAGELDRSVRLERPVADPSIDGAGSGGWALVDTIWAGVKDAQPANDERDGRTTRTARVKIRYRVDVTSAMRLVDGDRIMQIVSAPAELGRRKGLLLMVEDYTAAGNPA